MQPAYLFFCEITRKNLVSQTLSFARSYKSYGYPHSDFSPQTTNSNGKVDPIAPETNFLQRHFKSNEWIDSGNDVSSSTQAHSRRLSSRTSKGLQVAGVFVGFIISHFAHAQCTINSTTFPEQFYGNTNQFSIANDLIVSNIPVATSKQFAFAMHKCNMDTNTWLESVFSLEINPSSANYIEAYFHCDSLRQNGWVIRLGDTDDDIQLIRRKNGTSQIILKGAKGYFNRSKSHITIRIVKQPEQIIVLYKDSSWEKFQCLGAGYDTMSNQQAYHGWGITQSGSSAAGKHKVELWYIGPPRPDKNPPLLTNILWMQPRLARLQFSEPIQTPSRQQFICQFNAADSISMSNSRTVIVRFPKVFCNQFNTIHCQNLLDSANNVAAHLFDSAMAECETPIYPHQIIFSEIMVDPTPSAGYLPNSQYIEIYNATDSAKWLHTLTLSDAQKSCALPKYLLKPREYLLLHNNPDGYFNYLKNKAVRIENLPYLNLDNDKLTLMYFEDTIQRLNYSDKWYHPLYTGGGYALEKTNLDCGCIDNFNWHSNTEKGGTPGEANSTPISWPSPRSLQTALEPPQASIVEHQWRSNHFLEIVCSQHPEISFSNPDSTSGPQLILVSNEGDSVNATFMRTTPKGWLFDTHLSAPVDGKATLLHARDCAHRSVIDTQFQIFKSVMTPEPNDLQFNEIMFNANDGSTDYIELINTSNHPIQLKGLELLCTNNAQSTQRISLCTDSNTLFPNQIICFSTEPYQLAKTYNPNRCFFHQFCSTFPNLSASGAQLQLIINQSQNIIDIMQYNESQHSQLLTETKGVSLEKNHPRAPSSSPQFWLSATSTAGYATPAETNSQQVDLNAATLKKHKCFVLLNNVLGTDLRQNSESLNTLMLSFQMPQPGYILTASIYNMHGGLMGVPIHQAIIGKEGILPIPLEMSYHELSSGNYILHIDAFHREADICSQNLRWIYINR
jgi:hypothetical protein